MGLDSINIDIDLFDELGLSSIEAMQIPVNLSALGMYYSVEDIYTNRTIRNIVANHKNRKAYWYNDPEGNTEKPVIVVVSGYSSFNFLYTKWAEELKDEFSIFVLESYLTFIGFKVYGAVGDLYPCSRVKRIWIVQGIYGPVIFPYVLGMAMIHDSIYEELKEFAVDVLEVPRVWRGDVIPLYGPCLSVCRGHKEWPRISKGVCEGECAV